MGKGPRIFQRCTNYLLILGARRMAFSKFHTDGRKLWKPVNHTYFALSARSAWNDAQGGKNTVIMQNIVGTIIKKVRRPGRSGAWYFCTPGYGIIEDKDISSLAKKRSACKNDLANGVKRTRFQNFEQCNYSVFVPIMAVSWLRQTPAPAQARIRSQASPWGICGEKVALGHVSVRVFPCSSCLYHPTHTHTDI